MTPKGLLLNPETAVSALDAAEADARRGWETYERLAAAPGEAP
jgi:hypothetical protein